MVGGKARSQACGARAMAWLGSRQALVSAMDPSQDQRCGQAALAAAARVLGDCRRVLVLTGAGTSADSGVPTFRGEGGLWRSHRATDLASLDGFRRDPELVWDWYRERRLHVACALPHEGQRTLALLQQHLPPPAQVLVATTNEDDLLERAGVEAVLHLHGDLFQTRCAADCGWAARDDCDNALSFLDCPRCGAAVRPGSVWFGEAVPPELLDTLQAFAPDGCLVIGSSGLVQPAAAIPPELALAGLPVVELNPDETPLSSLAKVSLRGQARQLLPQLVDLLTSRTVRERASTVSGPEP